MALAINIEDLLNKQKIESNRIEFKKGWNPASIYHSVCAFANDFEDLGGGYILVGVDTDDETGMARRPVEGVSIEKIDGILQEMVRYNNKIYPYYYVMYSKYKSTRNFAKNILLIEKISQNHQLFEENAKLSVIVT